MEVQENANIKIGVKDYADNKQFTRTQVSLRELKTEKEKIGWFKALLNHKGEFMVEKTECIEYSYKPLKLIEFKFKPEDKTGIPNLIAYELIKWQNGNISEGVYRLMPTRKKKDGTQGTMPRLLKNSVSEKEFEQVRKYVNGNGFTTIKKEEEKGK